MEGSGHGLIYMKEINQRNISLMSLIKFKTGFSKIPVSITSLANLLSDKMYANRNCLLICIQYWNMCCSCLVSSLKENNENWSVKNMGQSDILQPCSAL